MYHAHNDAPPWLRGLRWVAALTGIAGGMLLALNVQISAWGFVLFAVSSTAWVASGIAMRVRSIVAVNAVLLLTNLLGIYRWLIA